MNTGLPGAIEQVAKGVARGDPLNFGMNGVNRGARSVLHALKDKIVEARSTHLLPHHFIPGRQRDRDLYCAFCTVR